MSHTTLSLLQGKVDLLILRALQRGPAHGYTVSRWVRERTGGVLACAEMEMLVSPGLRPFDDRQPAPRTRREPRR